MDSILTPILIPLVSNQSTLQRGGTLPITTGRVTLSLLPFQPHRLLLPFSNYLLHVLHLRPPSTMSKRRSKTWILGTHSPATFARTSFTWQTTSLTSEYIFSELGSPGRSRLFFYFSRYSNDTNTCFAEEMYDPKSVRPSWNVYLVTDWIV